MLGIVLWTALVYSFPCVTCRQNASVARLTPDELGRDLESGTEDRAARGSGHRVHGEQRGDANANNKPLNPDANCG